MKRLLVIVLAVIMLAGCGAQGQLPGQTEPVEETSKSQSIYIANSSVEQQTKGAVKAYVPEDGVYIGMATMAGKVFLDAGEMGQRMADVAGETIGNIMGFVKFMLPFLSPAYIHPLLLQQS